MSHPFEPTHPLAFYDARDRLAGDVRAGLVGLNPIELSDRLVIGAGVDRLTAVEWTEKFIGSLSRDVAHRSRRERK